MSEDRVLRRMNILRGTRIPGSGEKLNNEELNDLYSSRNIIQVIKSRR